MASLHNSFSSKHNLYYSSEFSHQFSGKAANAMACVPFVTRNSGRDYCVRTFAAGPIKPPAFTLYRRTTRLNA
jgi:hypothetical protein